MIQGLTSSQSFKIAKFFHLWPGDQTPRSLAASLFTNQPAATLLRPREILAVAGRRKVTSFLLRPPPQTGGCHVWFQHGPRWRRCTRDVEMLPSWETTHPWHRSHFSGVLLSEDDGFGGRFAPPETAGAEDGACVPRGRLVKVGRGAQLAATQGCPSA